MIYYIYYLTSTWIDNLPALALQIFGNVKYLGM